MDGESRLTEDKKNQERKRNLLVLIERHLLGLGFYETASKL